MSSPAWAAEPRLKRYPELYGWSGSTAPDVTSLGDVTGVTVAFTNLVSCDTIDTDAGGNFRCGTDSIGSGGGNSFETIAVPAGASVVAESSTDTLTITETSFLTITGTAATDTIDITQITTDIGTDGLIAANAVALGTDTTNAYVSDLTAGTAIDVSGGGAETANVIVDWDSTEVEATTWGAGGNGSNAWTFNLSAGDPTLVFGSNLTTNSALEIQTSGGNNNDLALVAAGVSATDADFTLNFSQGTLGSRTIVLNADIIGGIRWGAYDGTNYEECVYQDAVVGNLLGTAEPGSNDMPMYWRLFTCPDGSNTPARRLLVDSDGSLWFGTAGVKLTQDGDGALTFLGFGTGADEDLTFNFDDTTNEVTVTSSTGVTQVNFSGLDVYVSGTGPDVRWAVTGSDTFHAGAEAGGIWFLSNVTDGVHYLDIHGDHSINFGTTGNVPYVKVTTDGTGNGEVQLPTDSIGVDELDTADTPADEECATFEATGNTLEWQTCGGASGNSFETWAVPDANNIVADSATDTATLTETAGFDITGNAGTDTVNFAVDLTEVSTLTLGAGSFTALTFDAGATDPVLTAATTSLTFSGSGGTTANLLIDDQGAVRFFEEDAGGGNYKGFAAPATLTADTTCTFEDDANFIPDSCVGDGTDAGGTDTNADKEFWFPAPALLPLEAAESIPPIVKDTGTNTDMMTVDFDQSTDECRTVQLLVPPDITAGGTVTFSVVWYAASVTTNEAMWYFGHNSGVADGVDPDQALTAVASAACTVAGTAGQIDVCTWTETQTNLAWAASDTVVGVVCRDANNAGDDFAADAKMIGFGIRIPRS